MWTPEVSAARVQKNPCILFFFDATANACKSRIIQDIRLVKLSGQLRYLQQHYYRQHRQAEACYSMAEVCGCDLGIGQAVSEMEIASN